MITWNYLLGYLLGIIYLESLTWNHLFGITSWNLELLLGITWNHLLGITFNYLELLE